MFWSIESPLCLSDNMVIKYLEMKVICNLIKIVFKEVNFIANISGTNSFII